MCSPLCPSSLSLSFILFYFSHLVTEMPAYPIHPVGGWGTKTILRQERSATQVYLAFPTCTKKSLFFVSVKVLFTFYHTFPFLPFYSFDQIFRVACFGLQKTFPGLSIKKMLSRPRALSLSRSPHPLPNGKFRGLDSKVEPQFSQPSVCRPTHLTRMRTHTNGDGIFFRSFSSRTPGHKKQAFRYAPFTLLALLSSWQLGSVYFLFYFLFLLYPTLCC